MAYRFKFTKGSTNRRNKFLLGRKKSLRQVLVSILEVDKEDDPWLLKRLTTKEKRRIQQMNNNARRAARNS